MQDDIEQNDIDDEDNQTADLSEIKEKIRELADMALRIVRNSKDATEYQRAKSYWYASIVMALDDNHDYLGKNMFTLEDSIEALDYMESCDDDAENRN